MPKMVKLVLVIGIISAVSGTSLTYLNSSLAGRIETQVDIFVRGPALEQIFTDVENNPVEDRQVITLDEIEYVFYPGFKDGKCVSAAFESVGAGGYGGDITMMVGIDFVNSTIFGLVGTASSETPGIGSLALEQSYLQTYYGQSIETNFNLKGNGGSIDAYTGATFSSTAISRAVEKAAELIRKHQQEIVETLERNHETR